MSNQSYIHPSDPFVIAPVEAVPNTSRAHPQAGHHARHSHPQHPRAKSIAHHTSPRDIAQAVAPPPLGNAQQEHLSPPVCARRTATTPSFVPLAPASNLQPTIRRDYPRQRRRARTTCKFASRQHPHIKSTAHPLAGTTHNAVAPATHSSPLPLNYIQSLRPSSRTVHAHWPPTTTPPCAKYLCTAVYRDRSYPNFPTSTTATCF
jgi:hypothetical protein